MINIGTRVKVASTHRNITKEKQGKIIGIFKNYILIQYKNGIKECFTLADIIVPGDKKIFVRDGKSWNDIRQHRKTSDNLKEL